MTGHDGTEIQERQASKWASEHAAGVQVGRTKCGLGVYDIDKENCIMNGKEKEDDEDNNKRKEKKRKQKREKKKEMDGQCLVLSGWA